MWLESSAFHSERAHRSARCVLCGSLIGVEVDAEVAAAGVVASWYLLRYAGDGSGATGAVCNVIRVQAGAGGAPPGDLRWQL